MTAVDGLWFLADEATRQAERAYHRARDVHGEANLERTDEKCVSHGRFRTLADRINHNGTPYGSHTLVHRDSRELLLVRHDGVDLWVLPGGCVDNSESLREAAERELKEESGIEAAYRGLAMLNRIEIRCGSYETWGILPIFDAVAETTTPVLEDPDEEISAAQWFDPEELPKDTRDRTDIIDAARAVI